MGSRPTIIPPSSARDGKAAGEYEPPLPALLETFAQQTFVLLHPLAHPREPFAVVGELPSRQVGSPLRRSAHQATSTESATRLSSCRTRARSPAVIRPHLLRARQANQPRPYRLKVASPPLRPQRGQSGA